MNVFLLQDVPTIGKAGQTVRVTEGYARNFLFPRKLAVVVDEHNKHDIERRQEALARKKQKQQEKTSELAQTIGKLSLTLKRKMHDDGRLYGSISAQDVAETLQEQGISIGKSQVLLDKQIKERGTYSVTIKLSSKLQPSLTLKVVSA